MDEHKQGTGRREPTVDSPFEEPEQAPELREKRSENLYSRDEPFWNRVLDATQSGEEIKLDENYWNHPDVLDTDRMLAVDGSTGLQKLRRFLGSGTVKKFVAIIAVVLVVSIVLYSTLFKVRSITVVGNTTVSSEEVIRLSGLKIGQSSMTIDDEKVMRKVEGNRYLRCTLVDVQWDSVIIHVKERTPAVFAKHNGMVIVMDNRGFVLEESLETQSGSEGLIQVIGLDIRRCTLGQQITLNATSQMETYTQILVEMKAMKGLELLSELDMTSMDSIYLGTRDGFYVRLGSEESIHEKLRAFMITRDRVLEMGYTGGTIDVTDPGRPTYSP